MIQFRLLFVAIFLMLLTFPVVGFASSLSESFAGLFLSQTDGVYLNKEENKTQNRISAWNALIDNNKNVSDWQKLNKVNQFFNQVNFVEDKVLWGVDDYWASPLEFLTRNAGDCEDYSIAKYFTLKAMGVPVERLRIMYVTTIPAQQAHMVLVYLEGENKAPLVLDNLQNEIAPFVARQDLDPVYSFNANGLWVTSRAPLKALMKEQFVSRSVSQISHWESLSVRMTGERIL